MSILAGRALYQKAGRLWPRFRVTGARSGGGGECGGQKETCPPCPPPPAADACCPQPPPCPEPPSCPPRLCPPNPDPGNPCNYCPPPCPSDGPDLTKLKKLQCHYQQENGLPVFLQGGAKDTIFYHAIIISLLLGTVWAVYDLYLVANK